MSKESREDTQRQWEGEKKVINLQPIHKKIW